ncbi:MAG: ABC-F family ATP-binding cassette domain-containing protein [Paracoccaceae bacterium]
MSLLQTTSLSMTLGTPLFAGLDLTLHPGDRLGLVAANGRGKSTLLRALAGEVEPTGGTVTRARGLKIGHVAQDIDPALTALPLREVLVSALPPESRDYDAWRADVALDEFGFSTDSHDRPLDALSGGWQRLAMLARAWITEPDVLLLDEPTNHLDLARIGFLERWLNALPRNFALIAASHDRAFLDSVTRQTVFLRPEASRYFALPFSAARIAVDEIDAADERQFENEMKKAAQLRRQAAKLKNIGINSGSDLLTVKTKQLTERADRMEHAARPAHREVSAGAIRLANSGTHAKALVSLEAIEVTAPDGRLLFKTPELWIEQGDRVVLLGRNGAGKTRLINRVRDALDGRGQGIRAAASAVAGISDQGLTQIDPFKTPFDAVTRRFDLGDQRARGVLAGAGIRRDMQDKAIAVLSGGQRARLAMLVLRLSEPNFFLLDEPTNHLDIEGQEALEAELLAQGATCLLVSHDRSFVRTVGTRFWLIDGRRLTEVENAEAFFGAELSG